VQIDLASLPDDPATLQHLLREMAEQQQATLQVAVQQRDAEIDKLHLLIKRLLRHQFGRRSEQLSADQLQLGIEDLEQSIAAKEAGQDAANAGGDKPRRRPDAKPARNHGALPAHLPRYEVLIDVEHRDCPCCGGALHMIDELRSEQLDIVPAQLRVRVTRRPRYACRTCEGAVVVAPAPERPIDGGMATEALIIHVLVSKFGDSLPLYRQSQMLERQGIILDRSTLSSIRVAARQRRDGCGATRSMTGRGPDPGIRSPPMSTPRTARAAGRPDTWPGSAACCKSMAMTASSGWLRAARTVRSSWRSAGRT
jgi:transposase